MKTNNKDTKSRSDRVDRHSNNVDKPLRDRHGNLIESRKRSPEIKSTPDRKSLETSKSPPHAAVPST